MGAVGRDPDRRGDAVSDQLRDAFLGRASLCGDEQTH